MRVLILCIMILLFALAAFAQPSDYDQRQDERFYNYVLADAKLSGIVESQLSGIKWVLTAIAGAVIVGVVGLIFSMIKKKTSLPIILLVAGMGALMSAIPVQEAECQGGCEPRSCTADRYCDSGCKCDLDYTFTCIPR